MCFAQNDSFTVAYHPEALRRATLCRLAFMLSRFGELKYGEIANQRGIFIKTLENRIGKALRMLRTELSEYLPVLNL